MTEEQLALLAQLKTLVEEDDESVLEVPCAEDCEGCSGGEPISLRTMTDAQLTAQLTLYNWDLKRTAYAVLIYKAQASDVTLSSGLKLPDQSKRYLRMATLYRQNSSGMLKRLDEPEVTE